MAVVRGMWDTIIGTLALEEVTTESEYHEKAITRASKLKNSSNQSEKLNGIYVAERLNTENSAFAKMAMEGLTKTYRDIESKVIMINN